MLPRGIFETIRDEVTGEWKKLQNDELKDLDFSPNIFRVIESRKNEMSGSRSTYGEKERFIQGFGGET